MHLNKRLCKQEIILLSPSPALNIVKQNILKRLSKILILIGFFPNTGTHMIKVYPVCHVEVIIANYMQSLHHQGKRC